MTTPTQPKEAHIRHPFVVAVDPRRKMPPAEFPSPDEVPAILRVHGACTSVEPHMFDVDDATCAPELAARARAVCANCPLIRTCRDYAMANEPFGIWGGLDAVERLELRGAPLPDVVARQESDELRELFRQGAVARAVARQYDVTIRTVQRWRSLDCESTSMNDAA